MALLGYERSLLAAEADYFRLVRRRAPAVPVPDVVHQGHDASVLAGGWLFTTALPGSTLAELAAADRDVSGVRRALGTAVACLHEISGDRFGYAGARPHGSSWPAAFTRIMADLLSDADVWHVDLGGRAARIRRVVDEGAIALARVERPALLHVDLWDGNVLAEVDSQGTAHLSGLVDGERAMFGDPLVDFVSPALFRRIEDARDDPFLAGYADHAGADPLLAPGALHRLRLYRLHLALLMVVELPSRGETLPEHEPRREFLRSMLDLRLADVERPPRHS